MTDNDRSEGEYRLKESCDDCRWFTYWDGGPASMDPGLKHARDTGHTVTGSVVKVDGTGITRPLDTDKTQEGDHD